MGMLIDTATDQQQPFMTTKKPPATPGQLPKQMR